MLSCTELVIELLVPLFVMDRGGNATTFDLVRTLLSQGTHLKHIQVLA